MWCCVDCQVEWVGPPACWSCEQTEGLRRGSLPRPINHIASAGVQQSHFSPSYQPNNASDQARVVLGDDLSDVYRGGP